MSTYTSCGTNPKATMAADRQVLCMSGDKPTGNVTALEATVYLRRGYPGTDTLRFVAARAAAVPEGWSVTEGGTLFCDGGAALTEDSLHTVFAPGDVLLDVTREVKITATGEYALKVRLTPDDCDLLVTDGKRWGDRVYLAVLRVSASEFALLHTARGNLSTLTLTCEEGWDRDRFLTAMALALVV